MLLKKGSEFDLSRNSFLSTAKPKLRGWVSSNNKNDQKRRHEGSVPAKKQIDRTQKNRGKFRVIFVVTLQKSEWGAWLPASTKIFAESRAATLGYISFRFASLSTESTFPAVRLEDRVRFHVCAEAPILSVVTSMSVFLVFFTSRDRPLSLLSAPRFCALW
eukprot:GEMP01063830.1.p1 GENE.GEMP01063830.1~~GEMP01063830.1.p1  ORF type:complete len:161 (-),score=17.84 GEMP01063830.1:751-1233(-)